MEQFTVQFKWLDPQGCADLRLPSYETPGAAGLDVCAAVNRDVVVQPGERVLVPTGLAVALPSGCEMQVRPRSGLAVRYGLTVVNAPGTIDADYRGEIKIALVNLGADPVTVKRGDRIAQLVVAPVLRVQVLAVEELDDTQRGSGGFGHTGVR